MADFIALQPGVLEAAVQSLLQAKRDTNGLVTVLDGLLPLVGDGETEKRLVDARESLLRAQHLFYLIYTRNAKAAFGDHPAGSAPGAAGPQPRSGVLGESP